MKVELDGFYNNVELKIKDNFIIHKSDKLFEPFGFLPDPFVHNLWDILANGGNLKNFV